MAGRRVALDLRDVPYSHPRETVDKLPRLLSTRVGLLQRIQVGQRRAYSLTRARPVLVPASFIYLDYRVAEGEAVVGWNTSTGLAAGATLEEAVLRGVQEVVERDAFAISWLRRRVGSELEVDDAEIGREMRACFRTEHPAVDLRIYDIALDVPIACLSSSPCGATRGSASRSISE